MAEGTAKTRPPTAEWPHLECDAPVEEPELVPGSAVDGWAFSPAGIEEVSVWLDGQRVGRAEHGHERPDVAESFPQRPEAPRSGFRYLLDVLPAPASSEAAQLVVVAEDGQGRKAEVGRRVRALEGPPPAPPIGGMTVGEFLSFLAPRWEPRPL